MYTEALPTVPNCIDEEPIAATTCGKLVPDLPHLDRSRIWPAESTSHTRHGYRSLSIPVSFPHAARPTGWSTLRFRSWARHSLGQANHCNSVRRPVDPASLILGTWPRALVQPPQLHPTHPVFSFRGPASIPTDHEQIGSYFDRTPYHVPSHLLRRRGLESVNNTSVRSAVPRIGMIHVLSLPSMWRKQHSKRNLSARSL